MDHQIKSDSKRVRSSIRTVSKHIARLVAVATLLPGTLSAAHLLQTEITGRVVDETRQALERVEVIVNRQEVRGTTGATGIFTLQISPKDSTIAFRRIGYRPIVYVIRPLPAPGDTLLVELEASAVVLPEVIVSATATKPLRYAFTQKYDDVFRRQRMGLGTLLTRDAIDARLGASTEQLLDGIPGVGVWNGPPKRIRFARCQDPGGIAVFFDGVLQNQNRPVGQEQDNSGLLFKPPPKRQATPMDMEPEVEILSRINPADIEMIEVFRGPSEIPAVYHWNGCAVIAVWTRQG
jgi:hypothetical protein